MKEIPLTQGKFAIVDDEDYEFLARVNWYYSGDSKFAVYQSQSKRQKFSFPMHYLLCKNKRGSMIMHKNNDTFDNRKKNLVSVPEKVIIHHRLKNKIGKTSRYKGVSFCKTTNLWRVTIKKDGKIYSLGRYTNEREAGWAYNEKALELYGEYAYQNKLK